MTPTAAALIRKSMRRGRKEDGGWGGGRWHKVARRVRWLEERRIEEGESRARRL